MSTVRVVRILVYEGDPQWVADSLEERGVKERKVLGKGTITEGFLSGQVGLMDFIKPEANPPTSNDELLTQETAAQFLGVKPGTLEVWRCTERYNLPYIKVGGLVRYKLSDLQAWLKTREQR